MAKRILIITPFIKPGGGPPGYVYNLMSGVQQLLKEKKLTNQFEFLGNISRQRNKATGENFKSEKLNFRLLMFELLTYIGLRPLLSKKVRIAKKKINSTDFVVFQGFQDFYLAKYAHSKGIKVAYMPHSPSIMADEYKMLCFLNKQPCDELQYKKFKRIESSLIDTCDYIIFPSSGASTEYKDMFSQELSKKNTLYIKSGVDIFADDQKIVNLKKTVNILFAGRYVYHKGYDLFCDAAELVIKKTKNIIFFTAGDGPMKRSSIYIKDLGWRDDIFNVIKNSDIVVIPNRIAYYDLFPLECAALGKPMVMTNVGGNADQLIEFPDCVACEKINSESLSNAILTAINFYNENTNWGGRNKIKYDSDFTSRSLAKRWDDAFSLI